MNGNTRLYVRLLGFLISITACGLLRAENVKLQFLSFPHVPNAEPLQLLVGEGEVLDVETPTNRLSRTYTVPKLNAWMLGKMESGAKAKDGENDEGQDEKVKFDVRGQVKSTNSKHQIILLVRDATGQSNKFEMLILDKAGKGLRGGEFFIMNFSKAEIGGVVGDKKFSLGSRERIIIAPAPDREVGNRRFAIATLFFKKGEKAEPFFTKQWRLSENANSMVFLYHDPHNDRLRLHSIRNFLE